MTTLDSLHHKKIEDLKQNEKEMKQLKEEAENLRIQLEAMSQIALNRKTDKEITQQFQLEDRIEELKTKISDFEENNPFVEYYLNTGDLLCEYYSNMDTISKGDDSKRKRSMSSAVSNEKDADWDASKPKCVIDFFSAKHSDAESAAQSAPTKEDDAVDENDTPGEEKKYMSRQVLLDKYLQRTDPYYISNENTNRTGETDTMTDGMEYVCPDCGKVRMLFSAEAVFVCQNVECGRMDNILIDANKPAYKDMAHDSAGSYYSYKRINHFNEWLAQFQAKETTDIPDDVYNRILVELKKERVHNVLKITHSKMKEILKRLKLNKYYEHIPHIINRINGQPAPVMNRATEEKLRNMFKEVQAPFIKHCPADRKNFLSYSYVLHKFCELLGLDDFLHCFQLLKSREKLHHQDKIWEKICRELQWEFIKSI